MLAKNYINNNNDNDKEKSREEMNPVTQQRFMLTNENKY